MKWIMELILSWNTIIYNKKKIENKNHSKNYKGKFEYQALVDKTWFIYIYIY